MSAKGKSGSRKVTLTERAYDAIKSGILTGEIPEGNFLSESEIMRKYRIGRTPFREACNRLHHEELLEVVPHRGYLVPEMSFRDIRDLFEIRIIVEEIVAELAAIRAEPSQIAELGRLAQKTILLGNSKDNLRELLKANSEFHLCIARMTQNQKLEKLLSGILEQTTRISYAEWRLSRFWSGSPVLHHSGIVTAIRKRNPAAARKAIRNDISQTQKSIFARRPSRSAE